MELVTLQRSVREGVGLLMESVPEVMESVVFVSNERQQFIIS